MTDRLHEAFEAFEQSLPLTPAKPWYASRGVWGGLVAAGAGVAGVLGYSFSPAEQVGATELLLGLGSVAGGLVAMIGRVQARRVIR